MTQKRFSAIRATFPEARMWGNYGTIETFVVGVSWPECTIGVYHLLPEQLIETGGRGALLTRVGEDWPIPVVRYELADKIHSSRCACGKTDAFQVSGRADDKFKFYGHMFRISEILRVVEEIEGVQEAQLLLYREPGALAAVSGMCIRYCGPNSNPSGVYANVVRANERFKIIEQYAPGSIGFEHVDQVDRNPRTSKVISVIWRDL